MYNVESGKTILITALNSTEVIAKIIEEYVCYYDGGEVKCIKIDLEAPVIEKGQQIYVLENSLLVLKEKVQVVDNLSSKEEIFVIDNESVTFDVPGNYLIEFKCIDKFGNFSSEWIEIIVLESDETGPVFTEIDEIRVLRGSSTLNLLDYVKANDLIDGDTRIYILDAGGLDLNNSGKYKITLMSKDSSDNVSYKELYIVVYDNYDFRYYYEILLICGAIVVIIFSIIKVK